MRYCMGLSAKILGPHPEVVHDLLRLPRDAARRYRRHQPLRSPELKRLSEQSPHQLVGVDKPIPGELDAILGDEGRCDERMELPADLSKTERLAIFCGEGTPRGGYLQQRTVRCKGDPSDLGSQKGSRPANRASLVESTSKERSSTSVRCTAPFLWRILATVPDNQNQQTCLALKYKDL